MMCMSTRFLNLFVAVGLFSLTAACATPASIESSAGSAVPLQFYTPQEIIVPTRTTGTFKVVGRCIVFERDRPRNSRSPVLFPPGSALSNRGTAVRLPNGQEIAFGRPVQLAYEAPPDRRSVAGECPGEPIHVLNLVRADR